MSFKLQFTPQASTRAMRVPMRWIGMDACLGGSQFLSSWLDDDGDQNPRRRHINWGAIAGLALSVVISGGFWAGLGLLVARVMK